MTSPAPGSSSAAALLMPVNPSITTTSMRSRQVWGWEASQVLKTRLDRPGIISRSREGPRRSRTGVTSKMTVTYLSPYGVWRHTCSSTPMTRTPSHRAGSLISRRAPSSSVSGIPGHANGLGDAHHRHMMNDHARQRPVHRCARELGTRIGRLTHVLTPHVSTRLAAVAAHAHMQDRRTPRAGLERQAPDHRVTRNALAPAASTPPVLTSNTARQHCMVCLNALTRHLQPQAIQAREHAQIRAIKDSTWACRGLSDERCRNPHHRNTSTPTRPRHAQPNPQHPHPSIMNSHITISI